MRKLLLIFLLLPIVVRAQLITTVAGTGTFGYSGDGLAATIADIMQPSAVAVDHNGNTYFSDNNLTVIRMVTSAGVIHKIVGCGVQGYTGDGGPATQAKLDGITGIVIGRNGSIYIADAGNNVIRKISSAGIITTVAGSGFDAGTGLGGFTGDGGAATNARLFYPSSLAIDKYGNMFVADTRNYRLRKVDTNGIISTIAGNGIGIYSGDGGTATDASLMFPTSVAVDSAGNVFVQDNNHIRMVTPAGHISTVIGTGPAGFSGDGGPGFTAQFNDITGFVLDSSGNMYIADSHNERIRRVDASTGIVNTIAGTGVPGYSGDGGPAINARLNGPSGVAVDKYGNVYFADAQNNRVRRIESSTTLGISQEPANEIKLFPNPAAGEINLISGMLENQVAIFNLSGQKLFDHHFYSREVRIDISAFPAGTYFVGVNGSSIKEFVKQ